MADHGSSPLSREGTLFDDDVGIAPSSALIAVEPAGSTAMVLAPSSTTPTTYRPPAAGRSLRAVGRAVVLLGGSAAIGVGVAAGLVPLPAAGILAVGLATGQVLAQTWRQHRLGQGVVAGVALGDLAAAQRAAERAVVESPGGAMRTLAIANLASVLIQRDLVDDAARVLDDHPPGMFHMPLTTVLWMNNRAFAHLCRTLAEDVVDEAAAAKALLDEAEDRLARATTRDLGGTGNTRKLISALAGTRALERTVARDGRAALVALRKAADHDDGPPTAFRTIERELCRTEALRLCGKKDEATITLESLIGQPTSPRQLRRVEALRRSLGLA